MKRKNESVSKICKKIKVSYNKRKYIYNLKYIEIKKHKHTSDLCFLHDEKYICDIYECDGKIKNNFYFMPYNN